MYVSLADEDSQPVEFQLHITHNELRRENVRRHATHSNNITVNYSNAYYTSQIITSVTFPSQNQIPQS